MTQKEIRDYFKNTIKKGQISHAFILEGDGGKDWKQLAYDFAVTIQCEQKNHCGTCPSCRAFESGNHPDIIKVTHEKPDSIGVDEIRGQLVDDMGIKPYSSPYKVYLVDEAEKLTVQAQNALLKTMEEPPWYGVVILLTTNGDKLLPTIRSRCIFLKTQSQKPGEVFLEDEDRLRILSILHSVKDMNITQMADAAKDIKDRKLPLSQLMDLMRLWFRDLLVWKSTEEANHLILSEEFMYYREQAELFSWQAIESILNDINEAEKQVLSNVNYELALELLFLSMKHAVK